MVDCILEAYVYMIFSQNMQRSKGDVIYTIYIILRFLSFLGWKSHCTLLKLLQK